MWPLFLTEGQHVCVVFEIQKGSGIYHITLSSQLGPMIWKGHVTRGRRRRRRPFHLGAVEGGELVRRQAEVGLLHRHEVHVVPQLDRRECAHDLVEVGRARVAHGAVRRGWRRVGGDRRRPAVAAALGRGRRRLVGMVHLELLGPRACRAAPDCASSCTSCDILRVRR